MQTDELRAELAELANEVDPFEADVAVIRHRVARRRVTTAGVAVVLIVALTAGAIAITRSSSSRVHVAGSVKEVPVETLPSVGAVLLLPAHSSPADVARMREVLDETAAVTQYALLPPDALASLFALPLVRAEPSFRLRVCAAPTAPAFAVELSRRVPAALRELTLAVGPAVAIQPWDSPTAGVEVFMQVRASQQDTLAVLELLKTDPDVVKFRFLDHNAAYTEFKRLFADQPVLIQNETPAGLPESFRLELRDGVQPAVIAQRYQNVPGVDQVITGQSNPFDRPAFGSNKAAACAIKHR